MKSKIAFEQRVKAYDELCKLKQLHVPRKEIVEILFLKYGVRKGAIYGWYAGTFVPWGRQGTVNNNPELFYVLGALLGDGCMYRWKETNNWTILYGDERFTSKFAKKVNSCCSNSVKNYASHTRNIWFVRTNNYELFQLFKNARMDLLDVERKMELLGKEVALQFIEGFFDAEGCVKIIKESVRITPKVCLDFTNTNFQLIDLVRRLLAEHLVIGARYSNQQPNGKKNKLLVFHLRIYKKEYIRRFLNNINTTKLRDHKVHLVTNWLNNGL